MLNILSIITQTNRTGVNPLKTQEIFQILTVIIALLLFVVAGLLIAKILKQKQSTHYFFFNKGTRLYDLAFKDDLTDLFNRNAYIRDLGMLEHKGIKLLWFVIFDIDDFKTINDTQGHLFGDGVLISAASRLREVFNEKNYTIYRIGGDEFLVIARGISEEELVSRLLELKNIEIRCADFRFSKGYSKVENADPRYFNDAFDNADKMLYVDKNSRKSKDTTGFKK